MLLERRGEKSSEWLVMRWAEGRVGEGIEEATLLRLADLKWGLVGILVYVAGVGIEDLETLRIDFRAPNETGGIFEGRLVWMLEGMGIIDLVGGK